MIPTSEELHRLTDEELSSRLTEIRQTLEAIRPYYSRDLEHRRRALWQEYDLRHNPEPRRRPHEARGSDASNACLGAP
jgi:hypothetical protein